MPQALPISRLIDVAVNLAPNAAQAQNLSSALLLGSSDVIDPTERYRSYLDVASVAADFGTSAAEYAAAVAWFAQVPQPTALLIGRWVKTNAAGGVRGGALSATQQAIANFNAITNGSFSFSKDGAAAVNITGLNFSAAATLNDVAATIQAAAGVSGALTVVWNAAYGRFEAKSVTLGAASSVSFFAPHTGAVGTDVSALLKMNSAGGGYVFQGAAAESCINAVTLFDQNYGQAWYGLHVIGASVSELVAVSDFIEATTNKHLHAVNSQDAGILNSATTTDIAYQLKAKGLKKTFVQYSGNSNYAAVSALARQLTVDYTGNNTVITLMYKQEPGIQPETLNASQISALEGKNCNVFVQYNNDTAIFEPAKCSSGHFIDVITGTDWLATDIQTALYNVLYTSSTKIPQTDDGMHVLKTTIESRCSQAVTNGLLAPGVWQDGGFGTLKQGDFLSKGFYVYAPPVSSQSQADRVARKSVPFQVAAKLAGAVHSIKVTISVNQ